MRFRKSFALTAVVGMLSISTYAMATDAPTPPSTVSLALPDPAKQAIVKALEREGVTALQSFDTGTENLDGLAGLAGLQPVTVYLLPDGKGIVGTRIGADGKPFDVERVTQLIEKPLGDLIWSKLDTATWVRDGKINAPRVVYTFSDPNCPDCSRLWESARPWVDSGKVQLRHVLVSVIRPDSVTKAAAILNATDSATALRQNAQKRKQGGIKPVHDVSKPTIEKLQANQALMAEMAFRGIPALVYRDDKGRVQRASGLPPAEALEQVFGPR